MSHFFHFFFCALIAAFSTPSDVRAQQLYAPWKDEAAKDPTFVAFRERLLQAIKERDTEYVVSISSPDIYVSHGGNGGHAELREMLDVPESLLSDEHKSEAPAMRDEIWGDFEEMMSLGGVFEDEDTFSVPYTQSFNLPNDYDAYETLFVTGTSVLMRSGPNKDAPVVGRLNYHVVSGYKTSDAGEPGDYSKVTLQNGKSGYVHNDYLRSPIDWRAYFGRSDDGWIMGIFVAGD